MLLAAAPGATAQEAPAPPDGQWAPTTLALLRHSHQLCGDLGREVSGLWRRGLSPEAVQQEVLKRSSAMAAARATASLVRRFLPRSQGEAGVEVGSALGRLFELETALCDSIASPGSSRGQFEATLRDLGNRIELEQGELGRLLVVEDARLGSYLAPYLTYIQLARVEAEGELQEYLDGLKPPPKVATRQELMERWHGFYWTQVQPARQALGQFLQGRQKSDRALIRSSCRDLSSQLIRLLADDRLFRSVDQEVNRFLKAAYGSLKTAATSCTAGDFRTVDKQLQLMERQMGTAARRLRAYGLHP